MFSEITELITRFLGPMLSGLSIYLNHFHNKEHRAKEKEEEQSHFGMYVQGYQSSVSTKQTAATRGLGTLQKPVSAVSPSIRLREQFPGRFSVLQPILL
jgi:hypothetical protein